MEPSNIHVQKVLRDGIIGGMTFNLAMPDDVARWLAFEHNSFHHGGGYNLVEMYQNVAEAEAKMVGVPHHRGHHHNKLSTCT